MYALIVVLGSGLGSVATPGEVAKDGALDARSTVDALADEADTRSAEGNGLATGCVASIEAVMT
jgi:hypothetical protein